MLLSLSNMPVTACFYFDVRKSVYQKLVESIDYGWAKTDRAGAKPAWQATKNPETTISISGNYIAHFRGGSTKKDLKAIADLQQPLDLVSGDGTYIGRVVILKLSLLQQRFLIDGTPLLVDFTIELGEYND